MEINDIPEDPYIVALRKMTMDQKARKVQRGNSPDVFKKVTRMSQLGLLGINP